MGPMQAERPLSPLLSDHKSWDAILESGKFTSFLPTVLGQLSSVEIALFVDSIKLYASIANTLTPPRLLRPLFVKLVESTLAAFPIAATHEYYCDWFNESEADLEDCVPHVDSPPKYHKKNVPTDFLRTTVSGSLLGNTSGPLSYPGDFEVNGQTFTDDTRFGNFDVRNMTAIPVPEFTIETHTGLDVHARPMYANQRGILAVSFYPKVKPFV